MSSAPSPTRGGSSASPGDLPVVPPVSAQPAAGTALDADLGLEKAERVVGLVRLEGAPIAVGTESGTVKRVLAGPWPNRPSFDLLTLKPGDAVVAAAQAPDEASLVFVTSEAQLLRFAAGAVRPQGIVRPRRIAAGGMAGVALGDGARVIAFAVADALTAAVSATDDSLDGLGGRGKVTALLDFPAEGRATGGVRSQLVGRREGGLRLAGVGPALVLAAGRDDVARAFPNMPAKRDAAGSPLEARVEALGAAAT